METSGPDSLTLPACPSDCAGECFGDAEVLTYYLDQMVMVLVHLLSSVTH